MNSWVVKEYYVRPVYQGYEVAVFDGTECPQNVYYVQGLFCSCPAGGHADKTHKHVELVRLFQRMNEPEMFVFWRDEQENIWRAKPCIKS